MPLMPLMLDQGHRDTDSIHTVATLVLEAASQHCAVVRLTP